MRHMFGYERPQIIRELVLVFRIPLGKCYFTSKRNSWECDKGNVNPEALALSVDRVLNFSAVEKQVVSRVLLAFSVYFSQTDFCKSKTECAATR